MTPRTRRIALFDSGLGGLSVYSAIRTAIPDADIVYAADTARVPYGDRPLAQVEGFARQMIAALRRYDPSLLVIACGTSCSAFDASGYISPLPALAIVDCGIGAAVRQSASGRIGVIATGATIASGIFERKLISARPGAQVTAIAAPTLVPLVELGKWFDEAGEAVNEYCQPMLAAHCDTVILGCTHYPHLRGWFERSLGPGVSIVDPAQACAQAAAATLSAEQPGQGSLTLLISGDAGQFAKRAYELAQVKGSIESIDFSTEVEEPEDDHR